MLPMVARVGMVSNTYYPVDPRVRRQAEALVAHGYQVDVLCQRQPGEALEEVIGGVCVKRVGGLKYRGGSLRSYVMSNAGLFLRAFLELSRSHLEEPYAAVQVYSMPEALIFTALLPRMLGVPVIYDAGDLTSELFSTKFSARGGRLLETLVRWQERLCLSMADHVVTVHEDYRQRLLSRGVPDDRLSVTMNLPDHGLIERALRRRVPPDRDAFTLVHHGSLVERYGADLLVEAVARLRHRIPSLRLRIYGDGDLAPRLQTLVRDLGLEDRVTLRIGLFPLEDLLPEIAAADVAVVPHRCDAFTETILPNKLLEYLALGLPTIATRTRTVLYHVPEDTVSYCAPNDADALADAIFGLWSSPAYRQQLAQRAQAWTSRNSWSDAATKYCENLDDLITARRPSTAVGAAAS